MSDNQFEEGILESDRELPMLNRGGKSALPFIIGGIGFIFVLLWGVFGPKKTDVISPQASIGQEQTNSVTAPDRMQGLPTIVDRPKEPEVAPVVVEPVKTQKPYKPSAYELERKRLLQEEALRKLKERERKAKEWQAELDSRIRSPMLIMNDAPKKGSPNAAASISEAAITEEVLSANSSQGFQGFGGEGSPQDANEVFANKNERFLRDGANANVQAVEATKIENLDYKLTQGTTIDGVLETAVNTQVSGLMRAMVSADIYSRTGSQVLLPRGTRLIGRYQNGISRGQARVFVIWTRAERPDGIVIDLASYGADQLGRGGMTGKVDTHFFQRFGSSALLSIIGAGVIVAADGDNQSVNEREVIRDTGNSFNRQAEIALENSINIPPTIKIKQGSRLTVFVSQDLSFKEVLTGY